MDLAEWMIAALLALGALVTGSLAILAPRRAAKAFGLPLTQHAFAPYMQALGARNFALGLILGALLSKENRASLAVVVLSLSLTAVVDAALTRNAARNAFLVHALGAIFLLCFGLRLGWR